MYFLYKDNLVSHYTNGLTSRFSFFIERIAVLYGFQTIARNYSSVRVNCNRRDSVNDVGSDGGSFMPRE